MISLRKVTLRRGVKVLLDQADLTLHAGQRLGIVGPNGCGKSSFFALLRGDLHTDAGDVSLPPQWVIAHVAQETPAVSQSALDYTLDGDETLRRVEADIRAAEENGNGVELAHAHERYAQIEGYASRARAASLLDGLGFANADLSRSVSEFSGGWRMRLNLARALMCRSDLLLLDEPTNHLDLDAVMWLEQWLAGYQGTLMMISHDREFLDATANAIVHFEQTKLRLYSGNYSSFEQQRSTQLAQQQALHARQQIEIARLERFVERFRAKATKAKQAQSRMKALERMERIAPAHVDSPFAVHFREFLGSPDPVLRLEQCAVGYAGVPVLSGLKLSIAAGARIGLLGRNGAGKSTLVKLLAGKLAPLSGEKREGKNLSVGYFAQHQLEDLRADESPLQHLLRIDSQTREQELRNFLGGFDFGGDRATAVIRDFSGGEKARLALALIIWQRPNLLLLDEPTNHLDLDMREALTLALQEYEGAMVLVSHDRHLLRMATDSLMLVADGSLQDFDGDLEDYRVWLNERRTANKNRSVEGDQRREQKRSEAEVRNRRAQARKPLEQRLRKLEAHIKQLEEEKTRLETALSAENFYAEGKPDDVSRVLREQARTSAALTTAEDEWLALHEQIEALTP
ncbi:MAG TPA: ATP-binding cassette domain-containing protein [Burkholderiales bacterium]|nr:ATP-binding cassette domain-containing protein [Burkholderiales bacterium]